MKFRKGKRTQVFQDFWRGLQILDSCICHYNLDSGFQSLVGFRIPDSLSCIPHSKTQDSRFFYIPRAKFSQIPDSTSKHFRDFGIRIPNSLTWGHFNLVTSYVQFEYICFVIPEKLHIGRGWLELTIPIVIVITINFINLFSFLFFLRYSGHLRLCLGFARWRVLLFQTSTTNWKRKPKNGTQKTPNLV